MSTPTLRQALVHSAEPMGPGLKAFALTTVDGPIEYRSGQWLAFRVSDDAAADEKETWRAYSFCSAPEEAPDPGAPDRFRVLIDLDHAGSGAKRLKALAPGDHLMFHGPYGVFTLRPEAPKRAVLVADGVGIGPVRALARTLLAPGRAPHAITIIHEAAVPHALSFRGEFEAWEREFPELSYIPTVPGGESDWHSETRDLRELVPALFESAEALEGTHWYLCGSGTYTNWLSAWLSGRGLPGSSLRVERFFD
jgi:ferredoxin-NADP reductase